MPSTVKIFKDNWEQIELSEKIVKNVNESSGNYSKFTIEPLAKGFGVTIGHSLRRVSLSSLVGCAVVAVKINGVSHEFESIKGVREDVLNLLLNLKQVQFMPLVEEEFFNAKIQVKGPRKVLASDINCQSKLSVANIDHVICNIDDAIDLELDIIVKLGRGIVKAEENKIEGLPIGTIFLDSNHSPIERVRYEVLNTRVKQKTDYDKLIFEIWTNGCVSPDDALAFSAKILKDCFSNLVDFDEKVSVDEESENTYFSGTESNPHLNRSINELELTVRSINCLQNARIDTIEELVQKSEQDMLKTKNFGRKSLQEIKTVLASMGLTLGMKVNDGRALEKTSVEDNIIGE